MKKYKKKIENLKAILYEYNKVAIAFSGGMDSTFLLLIASKILPHNNIKAFFIKTEAIEEQELLNAKYFAKKNEINLSIIEISLLKKKAFIENNSHRCYYCKKYIFNEIIKESKKYGFNLVIEGSLQDDIHDYRPGLKAILELEVKSPLIYTGITKEDIRLYFSEKKILFSKPSESCLATRIPYGIKITKEALIRVAKAEKFIKSFGFEIVRVRDINKLAKIEIETHLLCKIFKPDISKKILKYLKDIGYLWISIDIEGYIKGSLNKILKERNI